MNNAPPSYISGGREAAPSAMFLEQIALGAAPWQAVGMARYVAPLASCDDATFGLFLPD